MSDRAVSTASARARPLPPLEGRGLFVPSLRTEAIPIQRVKQSPCTEACPAGIEVKSYVSLIAEERFPEALEVIRRHCPLPAVCGRVCHHPCEQACRRGNIDEPIAIRALKRFVTDRESEFLLPDLLPVPPRPERVAIIGSGPAGLTAAYDLRRAGFQVTVFEAAPQPGGMLRYGIAEYRLPRDILDGEIDILLRTGIDIETGRRLGEDIDLEQLLDDSYHAALLATGAQLGRKLGLPDEEKHPQVEDALAFLRRVSEGARDAAGRRVVVIGGGSTAVEAARTAVRLGAESVEILYRRSPTELLAGPEEIDAARAEGVHFRFLVAPQGILATDGRFDGLECVRVGLGEEDASGRRRPIPIPGSEFRVEADRVYAAVGQQADLGFLPSRSRTHLLDHGRLVVDGETIMTRLTGVFAAGDLASGPATVIDAIADGHRAAASIRHFLETGKPGLEDQRINGREAEYELPDDAALPAERAPLENLAPESNWEFGEVEQAFSQRQAVDEARRCRRCGPCSECRICAPTCHRRHVSLAAEGGDPGDEPLLLRAPSSLSLALDDAGTAGWLLPQASSAPFADVDRADGIPVLLQPSRASVKRELCRGCASCVEACPFEAVSLVKHDNEQPFAAVEPALCRGCGLCPAVCPTDAARSNVFSSAWWEHRVGRLSAREAAPRVVLTCQRRGNGGEQFVPSPETPVDVVRLRCVGQLEAGMLLELFEQGVEKVLVSGCQSDRCRFGGGARLARDQIRKARSMMKELGSDPDRIVTHWSSRPAEDDLNDPISRWLAGRPTAGPETNG